jgi:hypothetical protein
MESPAPCRCLHRDNRQGPVYSLYRNPEFALHPGSVRNLRTAIRWSMSNQQRQPKPSTASRRAGRDEACPSVRIESKTSRSAQEIDAEARLWSASLSDMIIETLFGETDDRH